MEVKFVSKTDAAGFLHPEQYMIWVARVSSPNQDNPEYSKLLKYCIDNKHWSVFEMIDMTVSIETSLAIVPQFLRHKSFSFQQFSGRYAPFSTYEVQELRLQGNTKQGSSEVVDDPVLREKGEQLIEKMMDYYEELLSSGISRECARAFLPLATTTKFYMKGSLRSWIHYLQVRLDEHAQKEHQMIAEEIKQIFIKQFPVTAKALGYDEN